MRARVLQRHLGRNLGRRWWQWAALLGVCFALQLLMLGWAGTAHAGVTVPYFQIKAEGSYTAARRYAGTIVPARTALLGFKRGGEIAAVTVDQGAAVARGDLLAQLDTAALRAQVNQAEAEVAHARASLNASRAAAQLARNTEQRMRRMREAGHASKQTYDEIYLDLQAKLAQLEVAKANLLRAQAAQQGAHVDLQEAAIHAPFDGIIQTRHVDEGTQVNAGQPILRLVENNQVEAHVGVPSNLFNQLQPGNHYPLYVQDRPLTGQLQAVLPEVDNSTRTVNAIFTLEQADLAMGSVVELEFAEAVASPGFWIPMSALTAAERGMWSVYVINPDDVIERRLIEVVHSEDDRVFARGTLSDADRVVHTGVQRIVPGQQVAPVPALQASR